eukprot:1452209-Amphidinium_carterae.1
MASIPDSWNAAVKQTVQFMISKLGTHSCDCLLAKRLFVPELTQSTHLLSSNSSCKYLMQHRHHNICVCITTCISPDHLNTTAPRQVNCCAPDTSKPSPGP